MLNAQLGADFDLDAFEHVAVWDAEAEWIEMRLRSAADTDVRLPGIGLTVHFGAGEEMRTEISAKFRRDGVERELAAAGFDHAVLVDRHRGPVRAVPVCPRLIRLPATVPGPRALRSLRHPYIYRNVSPAPSARSPIAAIDLSLSLRRETSPPPPWIRRGLPRIQGK